MLCLLSVRIFIILIAFKIVSSALNCFPYKEDYKCKLGNKSPYRFVANYNDTPVNYPGCKERKLWLIVRHGTRYPKSKIIRSMADKLSKLQKIILNNYRENRTSLSHEDILCITKWKLNLTESDDSKLAEEGENEMIDLAERYQSRFPFLMPEVYSNQTYKFKYTATQRTEESAKHFAIGLFGLKKSKDVWYPSAEDAGPTLRFYKHCLRWQTEVDNNPDAYNEKQQFLKSKVLLDTLRNISARIDYEVDHELGCLLYITCSYETAWGINNSPWCTLLSLEDFKVFEYLQDLKFYWIDGYGYRLTYEQACVLLKDMFDFFQFHDEATVTVYFTHSGTILKVLALLGIAKDDYPLMHDSFSLYGEKRAWRNSIIDTFATNIAFVLYDCANEPGILLMHQERPVYLPGCPSNMPCPLSVIKEKYPDREDECQFDKMCALSETDVNL